MKTKLNTAPVKEPLELEAVKNHLRLSIGETEEDDILNALVETARSQAETYTNRKFISQRWEFYLDGWPNGDSIALPYPPFTTETAPTIVITNSDNNTTTVSSTRYQADAVSEPGRLVLRYGADWPADTLWPNNPIKITFSCGYGLNSTDIPTPIRQAMLMMIGHWYENREDTVVGQGFTIINVPQASKSLLYPFRNWSF